MDQKVKKLFQEKNLVFIATINSYSGSTEGLGVVTLDYIKNNMLGSAGFLSTGGGNTDIEGDDS